MSRLVILFVIVRVTMTIATDESSDDMLLMGKMPTQREIRSSGTVLSFSINEHIPVGTVVADLVEHHRNTSSIMSSQRCQPPGVEQCPTPVAVASRYVMLGQRPKQGASFTLNSTTGIITTSGVVDRELTCSRREAVCVVTIDIVVQTQDVFDMFRVMVTIDDINDHSPVFPPPATVHLSIPESTDPNDPSSMFPLPVAIDADSLPNGVMGYRLKINVNDSGIADTFHLVVTGLNTSDPEVKLALKQPLDYESLDEYRLMLVAYDGGSAVNSGSVSIIIEVEDINDNSPVFEQSVYHIEVSESTAIGSVLLTPTASDLDSGYNGIINYRLSARSQGRDDFRIDDVTGQVSLARRLDCSRQSSYTLGLVAFDQGASPLSGYSVLTVHVHDVNNHAPVIELSSSHVIVQVPPSGRDQIFVAHVSVSDDDSGENAHVTCFLRDVTPNDDSIKYLSAAPEVNLVSKNIEHSVDVNNVSLSHTSSPDGRRLITSQTKHSNYTFNLVNLFDKEFKITADRMLPAETQRSHPVMRYLLLVTCHDHGTPLSMMSTSTLSVSVTSVPDTLTPLSRSSSGPGMPIIVFPTPENDTVRVPFAAFHSGQIIARIVASYSDGVLTKPVVYELVDGNGSSYFRVDRMSGHVTVVRAIGAADPTVSEDNGDLILQLVVGASFIGDSYTALSLATLFVVVVDRNSNESVLPHEHGRHSYDDVGLLIRLTSRTAWPKYVAVFVGIFVVVLGVVLSVVAYIILRRRLREVQDNRRFRNKVTSSYHVAFEYTTATDSRGSLCTLNNGAVVLNNEIRGSVNSLSGCSSNSDSAGRCLKFGSKNYSAGSLCCTSKLSTSQRADQPPEATSILPDIVLFDNASSLDVSSLVRAQNGCDDNDDVLRYCEQVDRSLRNDLSQQSVATDLPIIRNRRCILCDAGVCRSCDPPAVVTSTVQTWRPTHLELTAATTSEVNGSNQPMTSFSAGAPCEIHVNRDDAQTIAGRKRVRFAPFVLRKNDESLSDATDAGLPRIRESSQESNVLRESSDPDNGSLV